VAFLDKAEWKGIKLIINERKKYTFKEATKENDKLIRVLLIEKGNALNGIYIIFEKENGQWKENKEKEEKCDMVFV
jgi:hypothetical protein